MLLKILKLAFLCSALGTGVGVIGLFNLKDNPYYLVDWFFLLWNTILLYAVITLIKQINTNSTDIKLLKEEIENLKTSTTEPDNEETEN